MFPYWKISTTRFSWSSSNIILFLFGIFFLDMYGWPYWFPGLKLIMQIIYPTLAICVACMKYAWLWTIIYIFAKGLTKHHTTYLLYHKLILPKWVKLTLCWVLRMNHLISNLRKLKWILWAKLTTIRINLDLIGILIVHQL